jgi:isopenicillin-N epimerase
MAFGREKLSLWPLDPAATYLNHGTVGVVPRRVLEAQQRWRDRIERHPSRFMLRELWSFSGASTGAAAGGGSPTLMRQAAAEVAAFVGADAGDLVFVDNTTTGVNAVVQSLPLAAGDEIVITDHAYGGIVTAVRHAAARNGASVSVVQMPYPAFDADEAVRRIEAALSGTHEARHHRPHRFGNRLDLSC